MKIITVKRVKRKFVFLSLLIVLLADTVLFAQSSSNHRAFLKQRLEQHVYTLASNAFMGRRAGSKDSEKAAEYIVKKWREIGLAPFGDNGYFQDFEPGYRNILAVVQGSDSILKNEYILVGAHYDHLGYKIADGDTIVYNGADDNASGVAALIELGRKLKEQASGLKRSVILVAFDAEELGLLGSEHFVKQPVVPLDKIKLMYSVDMVGWYKTSGYVEYLGVGTIVNGAEILSNKNLIPENLNVTTGKFETSLLYSTDTAPFAALGIPTLFATTGVKSPYHQPEDDADLIDYDGLALITEHLTNLVRHFSTDGTFRASKKRSWKHKSKKRFEFGISANFGSNYHYYDDGALDGKSAPIAGIGLTSQLNMGYFAIRPEILYEYQKAKYPAGNIATNNLTLPLNFVVQVPDVADVFIGGYYIHRLGGTTGNEAIDFSNMFYRNEGGIQYGVSVKFARFKVGYTYRIGLSNFTRFKNADNANIQNRTSYCSLTYLF